MKRILTLLSALAALLTFAPRVSAAPTPGEKAPEFTLPTVGGNVSLADFRGKWVVVEWFNPNCPFVRKFYGAGHMQAWQKEWSEKGVVWLLVSSSHAGHPDFVPVEQIPSVLERLKITSARLLIDESGDVGHAYGATNTPQVYLINPEGVLVYMGAVDDKRTSDADDVLKAHNFLVQALGEALDGKPVSEPVSRPYGCSVKYAKK